VDAENWRICNVVNHQSCDIRDHRGSNPSTSMVNVSYEIESVAVSFLPSLRVADKKIGYRGDDAGMRPIRGFIERQP
jgi:hypothetical protein